MFLNKIKRKTAKLADIAQNVGQIIPTATKVAGMATGMPIAKKGGKLKTYSKGGLKRKLKK